MVWRAMAAVILVFSVLALAAAPPEVRRYSWLDKYDAAESIAARIPSPAGYARTEAAAGTFEDWLRNLPLKKGAPPVHLYNGQLTATQDAHAAVVDIDVGTKDLQQCADSIIRLRAEYLYAIGQHETIHFNFTSGDRADFSKWAEGFRPVVKGSAVTWVRGRPSGTGYASFRAYLDVVFAYAGTVSLAGELHKVAKIEEMRIGDLFIHAGSPGHAVIVADMAFDARTGKKVFLLVQGFMPAQEMHVLKNPTNAAISPWYDLDFGENLRTPQWVFPRKELVRF
jgi:hypothetical protein